MNILKTLLNAIVVLIAFSAYLGLSRAAMAEIQAQKVAIPASIKVLATYPHGNFLENLEVQQDGRLLFTNYPTKSIEVMSPNGETKTFAKLSVYPLSLISIDDGYLIAASGKSILLGENVVETQQFILLDKNGKQTGQFSAPQIMYLNGMVRLNSEVILAADSISGTIWQVNPKTQKITSWIQDESLSPFADQTLFIPGANGLKLRSDGLIVSNTSKGTLSLIKIGKDDKPENKPELIATVGIIDDFWVRNDGSIIFTTHGEDIKAVSASGKVTTIIENGAGGATAIAPYPLNQDTTFIAINDGNLYFGKKDLAKVLLITVNAVADAKEEKVQQKNPYEGYKIPPIEIPSTTKYMHKYIDILGSKMAYIDVGKGDPILFLHGQPTSSYLWRNVMPHLEGQGRLIAPDNIGFGKSDQPEMDYTFGDQYPYLEAFIKKLGLKNITLVVHDWGSGMGLHYARLHSENIKGIVTMEALMAPLLPAKTWEDYPAHKVKFSKLVRSPVKGRKLVIEDNWFLKVALPAAIVRPLDKVAHEEYLKPFPTEKSRIQVYQWPKELPIAGSPKETEDVISAYNQWLEETEVPWLFLYATPGSQNPPEAADYWEKRAKNIQISYIGNGIHYVQEDQPYAIGRAIHDWYRRINK